ncbi:ABC transporter substrate-binding protein [Pyxidicoccus sp. MSG2]|uniref:ABC transporter substrate-binding protein n=1 Tax=Pyxidicoccus sp. MSG2 TaxID=2996790 RepID=UPI0022714FA8|nr:ABC transporter substrate-binding protein [Pyxidicoccus sp. MSG2]MCY1023593.1 ABC transporter substrate-binding protein [Pyxidicoccus sp. MSG2]
MRWAWVLAAWVLVAGCKRTEAPRPVDPALAKRGRSLFQRGQSVRGEPLMGFLAPERVELSGGVAACARCHGPGGRGSREGGVEVPDITPGALGHVRSRAVGEVEDRARPAYTRELLLRAVTEGVSASGRELGVAMPRYALGEVEREELLGYLQQLGDQPDPGVTASTLTVGAALPLSGRLGPLGQEAAAVVRAVFADVNAGGGIFRRKLELVVEDDAALHARPGGTLGSPDRLAVEGGAFSRARPGGPAAEPDATSRLLDRGVLAMVASVRQGALPSDSLLAQEGVPLVLPLTLGGGASDEDAPVFFLYPDEPALARLTVQHLARLHEPELRRKPLAVAHAGGEAGSAWARAVREEAERRELAPPVELAPSEDGTLTELEVMVKRWAAAPPPAVLYAGTSAGLGTLLRALEAHAPGVPVFAPASLADPVAVGSSAGSVRFVYPAGLGARAPDLKTFAAFMERHGLEPGHTAFQLGAYAAARVLVEALTRTGADVTRASLVQHLEALRDFDTGVSPPVTFGINRRVGVQGAQLAALDVATGGLVAASEWIPLTP